MHKMDDCMLHLLEIVDNGPNVARTGRENFMIRSDPTRGWIRLVSNSGTDKTKVWK